MNQLIVAVGAVLTALLGCVCGFVLLIGGGVASANLCGPAGPGVSVNLESLPRGAIAGFRGEQLVNAALIMNAGQRLGLDTRAQTVGVMTAIGESTLIVVDHGDAAGPDSRGLFQQRANGAWGSYADRMDPTTSATNFFRALLRVSGWQQLPPTIAAHRTQRNADPYHYARFWDAAVQIVRTLGGVQVTGITEGVGELACIDQPPAQVGDGGWTAPARGPITGVFGEDRGDHRHSGTDIAAACNAPIYAANAGRIVQAGPVSGYGNLITLDHGGSIVSRYAHMTTDGILVRVGTQVSAGRQIATVGSTGHSTGCHLHFEVLINNQFQDPEQFMRDRGAPLR